MRFQISSTKLASKLSTVGRVIGQKNTLAILDCFRFDFKGNELTITASDVDSTFVTKVEVTECDMDFTFAVNAKTILDALKEIPEQPLTFFLDTNTFEMAIEYLNGQFRLMAQSAEEYPTPVLGDDAPIKITIDSSKFINSVLRASIAAANDILRPQLNCVCLDLQEKELSIVASNGNQLSLTTLALPTQHEQGNTFLLSAHPALLLRQMLSKEKTDVEVSLGQRCLEFETAECKLTTRLVEGRYPKYKSVIPQNNPYELRLDKASFVGALRRIMTFANPNTVLVKLQIEADVLIMSSSDVDYGKSAKESMPCEYQGTPMKIAFKGSKLLELIQNIDADEITMKLSDPGRAGVIVPSVQKEDEEVLMLIMPSIFND